MEWKLMVEPRAFDVEIWCKSLMFYYRIFELGVDGCCGKCGQLSRGWWQELLLPVRLEAVGWDPFPDFPANRKVYH